MVLRISLFALQIGQGYHPKIMDLSLEHADLLLHVAHDASLGSTFEERMDAVSDSLLALVPGSSLSMIVLDPGQPELGVRAFMKNADPRGATEYAAHYAEVDPLPTAGLRSLGLPQRLSDQLAAAQWGKDAYTGEFLPRYGLRHVFGFIQPLSDGRLLQVAMHRESRLGDFANRELKLLELTSMDLAHSAFGVLLREQLSRTHSVLERESGVGVLVFDRRGLLERADAGARALVHRLGDRFPMERLLRAVHTARVHRRSIQHVTPLEDGALVIRARPLGRLSNPSVMAIVELRSLERRADFAQRVAPYKLTPREREVAQLAVLGLTNQQIATELGISPTTVSVHLTKVFSKVRVSGRTELTRLLTQR